MNLSEAKELFNQVEKGKLEKRKVNKNGYFLALTPNWGSFEQNKDLTDKNYSKVETTLFESNVKGEILFVKENDSIKQFLFMTRIDSVSAKGEIYNARLYFFETTGELVDAYKMENQIITKRWGVTQQKGLTARGVSECGRIHKKIVSEIDDWEIGCNRGGGGNNPWGPNPFTFDGVNELYEVTVTAERWDPFGDKDLLFINQIYTRATQNHHQADAFENNRNLSGVGGTIIRGYIAKRKLDSKDHIIDELKNPCAKRILNQMRLDTGRINIANLMTPEIKRQHNFSQMIIDLFEKSSQTHLTFTNGTTKNGANGSTSGTTITLNNNYLQTATQLAIARTIIHEMVHAYLNATYRNYSGFENKPFWFLLDDYFKKNKSKYKGANRLHHEFMKQYVEAMAFSLQQWDIQYGTRRDLGFEYYKALSFGGLFQTDENGTITTETDGFKELVPKPEDRQDIANKILNEQNNNGNAKGTKCR
ncbi:SprT-like domain-containing protein [Capnocytophaga canis]|uniref:SprT-like domain-containing protein n=1 Tax=Capnocytophaga canis TaxID=1848903 RepID=UPI00370D717B